jgi:histone-lysine N-methyltransferase MLL1
MNRNFDDTFWLARKALLSPEISSSMKYRHLKNFSKRSLVVKRSPIHGRGLFTLADLQQGQMIIEYSGEIIRNQLCDKREKYYETKVRD